MIFDNISMTRRSEAVAKNQLYSLWSGLQSCHGEEEEEEGGDGEGGGGEEESGAGASLQVMNDAWLVTWHKIIDHC